MVDSRTYAAHGDTRGLKTVTSLALLKVDLDERGSDYLDYLTPFVAKILADEPDRVISAETVRSSMQVAHGLSIPHHTIELLIRRLVRKGYLAKDADAFVQTDRLQDLLPAKTTIDEVSKRQLALLTSIVRFAANQHGENWTPEDAAEALLRFVSEFSIDCIGMLADRPFEIPGRLLDPDATFIVGSFAAEAYRDKSGDFDLLVEVVKGSILANALLCEDLALLPSRLRGVKFYMDTPLLLDLIGATGVYPQAVAREWIGLVEGLGGKLRTFEHLVEETNGVLETCERLFSDPPAHDRVINAMRREGKGPSDIALLRGELAGLLSSEGVTVKPTPNRHELHQIDEDAFAVCLDAQMRYRFEKAKNTDVQSVAAIYQLREGVQPRQLESRGGVYLVTSNGHFASASRVFASAAYGLSGMSAVITDYSLANAAWLKSPLAAPDLPRLELIAQCSTYMRPPEKLWGSYVRKVEELVERDQYDANEIAILRYSLEAQDELMHLTRGSDSRLTGLSVREILEGAKARIAENEKRNTDIERTRADGLQAESDQWRARVSHRSGAMARCLLYPALALAGLAVVSATVLGPLLPLIGEGWPYWLLLSIPLVASTYGLWALFTKKNVYDVLGGLVERFAAGVEKVMLWLGGR